MDNSLMKLEWRYASKRMNGTKIPQDKIDYILEAIRLTPTSMGLQAMKVIVVESDEARKNMIEPAYNQPQIEGSSHVLVFCIPTNNYQAWSDKYMSDIIETRHTPVEDLSQFKSNVEKTISRENVEAWLEKQTYIAIGFALYAAAEVEVDSTPMEGFDSVKMDEALGLNKKNLHSVLIMPLGYRDTVNDYMAPLKKVRKKKEDLFSFM